ncbi:hypothetical protein EV363DRAFT_1167899, partial [Boletus edulis]
PSHKPSSSFKFHAALDVLESIGALQRSNRLDITEFLSPAAEAHRVAVSLMRQTRISTRRLWKSEAAGTGGDIDDGAVEPALTRDDAIQAALSLRRYTKDLDD